MSNNIRQSNLFLDTDWKIAYESFLKADYASYDYDSLYESMVDYIRDIYGEEFNDFIRSSEVLAHVNLLSYIGQSYALRNDINAKENFLDAVRDSSLIKIANTLTYKVKRNIPNQGLLKISAVKTDENVLDSNGFSLSNKIIFWNQQGLPTWYDSFIKIIESTLNDKHRIGNPVQRQRSGNDTHDIYELNQSPYTNYTYAFNKQINGDSYDFEIVPIDLHDNGVKERTPSNEHPFSMLFKNGSGGNQSNENGFFVYFKEGILNYQDFYYKSPIIDRTELIDVANINNDDVWVNGMNDDGSVKNYWTDIPKSSGQNIIYNEIDLKNRHIYFSKTKADNKVEILYGDGNFSKSPTEHIRVWYRPSSNTKYKIKKNDFYNIEIRIPYISRKGQPHTLTLYVTATQDYDNAQLSEDKDDIKRNLVSDHYSQERMVTLQDYNILPYQYNDFRKIRTYNRDNASKLRYPYLDHIDPTGLHSNSKVNVVDGYMYDEYYPLTARYYVKRIGRDGDNMTQNHIDPMLNTEYFKLFTNNIVFNEEYKIDDSEFTFDGQLRLFWDNKFTSKDNTVGNLYTKEYNVDGSTDWNEIDINDYPVIRYRSKLRFLHDGNEYWSTIISTEDGLKLSDYVPTNAYLNLVVPYIETTIDNGTRNKIVELIKKQESFGLRYDIVHGKWVMIREDSIFNTNNDKYDNTPPKSTNNPDYRWLIRAICYKDVDETYYDITVRGLRIIAGSDKQARFFFKNTEWVNDINTGLPALDSITYEYDSEHYGDDAYKSEHDIYVSKRVSNVEFLDI